MKFWNAWTRKHIIQFIFIQFISHVVSKIFQFLSSCVWFFWERKVEQTNWNSMYGGEHDGMLIHENFHPGFCRETVKLTHEKRLGLFSIYFCKRNNFPTNQQNQRNWKKISRLTEDYKYNYFLIVSLFTLHPTNRFSEIYIL